jgi:uncharacterized protein (DUF305 family)
MLQKAFTGLLLFLACAVPAASQMHHGHSTQADATEFDAQMSASMDKMHIEMSAAPHTGDADRDFLAMMIPHHAGAVDMGRLVLIYGRDPLVRQLAEEIIASQQAEIAGMQARLKVLSNGPDLSPGGFPAVTGTRGR